MPNEEINICMHSINDKLKCKLGQSIIELWNEMTWVCNEDDIYGKTSMYTKDQTVALFCGPCSDITTRL